MQANIQNAELKFLAVVAIRTMYAACKVQHKQCFILIIERNKFQKLNRI